MAYAAHASIPNPLYDICPVKRRSTGKASCALDIKTLGNVFTVSYMIYMEPSHASAKRTGFYAFYHQFKPPAYQLTL
jgi:hypothetical protein